MDIQFQAGDKVRIKNNHSTVEFVEYDNSGERQAVVLKQEDGPVSRVEDVFQVGDEVEWWTVKNYTDEDRQGLNGKRGIVVGSERINVFLYYVLPVDEKIRRSGKHFPSDRGSWLTEKSNLKLVHRATDPRREGDEYEVIVEPPRGVIEFKIGDKLICREFNASGVYPYRFSVVGAPNGYASEFVCPQETVQSHFLRVKRACDKPAVVNHQTSGAHKPAARNPEVGQIWRNREGKTCFLRNGDEQVPSSCDCADNFSFYGSDGMNKKFKNLDLIEFVSWAPGYGHIENPGSPLFPLRPLQEPLYDTEPIRIHFEGRNSEGRTYSDQRMLDERLERECNAEREEERRYKIRAGEYHFHKKSKSMLRRMVVIANETGDGYNNKYELLAIENIKLYCAENGIDFEKSISKPGAS